MNKLSILFAALFAVALSACGKKEEPVAPAPAPVEQAAPAAEQAAPAAEGEAAAPAAEGEAAAPAAEGEAAQAVEAAAQAVEEKK